MDHMEKNTNKQMAGGGGGAGGEWSEHCKTLSMQGGLLLVYNQHVTKMIKSTIGPTDMLYIYTIAVGLVWQLLYEQQRHSHYSQNNA